MLPSSSGNVWPEGEEADAVSASWSTTTTDAEPSAVETCKTHQEITASSSCAFKSMLESDWFINNTFAPLPTQDFFKPFISPDLAFSSNLSFLTDIYSQSQPSSSSSSFFPPNSYMSSLFSAISGDPFDQNGYFDSNNANLFLPNNPICTSSNSDFSGFLGTPELNLPESLQGFENAVAFPGRFNNMGLRPLDVLPIDGLQQQQQRPTLFEKRAALRQNSVAAAVAAAGLDKCVNLEEAREGDGVKLEKMKKRNKDCDSESEQEDVDDVSCLNYDSDEAKLQNNVDRPNGSDNNDGADENLKGKKKGPPAKNLMAERRRRKKLNDRLYMLRSIVPKISKMDRASILGDAIEYLKELLQRINDLHQELEATSPGSSMQQTSNFQPLAPALPTFPCRVKEELCPSSLPSPKNNQPARVEVIVKEGQAVNIHMFCSRRPGLLLSTISALDNLGLDIQQAVISCFNGFALDVFHAEQCSEGQDVLPEQVKAVLLDSAGYHGVM